MNSLKPSRVIDYFTPTQAQILIEDWEQGVMRRTVGVNVMISSFSFKLKYLDRVNVILNFQEDRAYILDGTKIVFHPDELQCLI